jgi:hypothetical protein
MNHETIKQLIESEEPLAIVRYFEWAIFSRSYDHPKYILLKINHQNIDIEEIEVPDHLTSFLVSKLFEFEKIIQEEGGGVWERYNFRAKVKHIIPYGKICHFITY